MILDNILQEQSTYDKDNMVDMFVEGFLYALEIQEAGFKASSIEELSNTLSEAADTAISELSAELKKHSKDVAIDTANKHYDHAMKEIERGNKKLKNPNISHIDNTNAGIHYMKSIAHLGFGDKKYQQAKRIEIKLSKKK